MADKKIRISEIGKKINATPERLLEFLKKKGNASDEDSANAKIEFTEQVFKEVAKEFGYEGENPFVQKNEDKKQNNPEPKEKIQEPKTEIREKQESEVRGLKIKGSIDLNSAQEKKQSTEKPPLEQNKRQKTRIGEVKVAREVKQKEERKEKNKTEKQHFEKEKTSEQEKKIVQQQPQTTETEGKEVDKIETEYQTLKGITSKGSIDLSQFQTKTDRKKDSKDNRERRKKKRIGDGVSVTNTQNSEKAERGKNKNIAQKNNSGATGKEGKNTKEQQKTGTKRQNRQSNNNKTDRRGRRADNAQKVELTDEEIKKQVRETYERLQGKSGKSKASKYRREKKDIRRQRDEQERRQEERESTILKITEFVTVSDLSVMMDVPVNKIIGVCMSLGMMVTMNQRLDADAIKIVAEEFGFEIEFSTPDVDEFINKMEEDTPEDLEERSPVVTIMGHVDHGKTSLLDYIRNANVVAGESGGITQHIGAYSVTLKNKKKITFIDTPGHEAFTAMRARGANITDIVIIVIAADSEIMPQTKEAISHAQVAGVPIIFAINKVDKPEANPDKIKEQLANMNLLVEEWGGKYQSQDISAKKGLGVTELIDKILLEAEMLELKANPNKNALGVVIETFLDKGKGYLSTVLVQEGTLSIGDYMLAGTQSGKVKAMFDERGKGVRKAGPSTPVSVLGLDGPAQAGDKFYIFDDEKEAKQIAQQRTQLLREQSVRTQKHITLDEIGRRIALGDFKEINIILKGDVDGSVEALSNSLESLTTQEISVSIIHKGVGAITESDVLLASSSDAVIVGFNVRPITNAKALAEQEGIDIRTYSIIYDAIEDLKDAMEGMLSPEMREEITGTAEIRELFKISKVGTVAGCMVINGKVFRNSKIRVIRDGVVVYTGELASLKRFKDDVKEVGKGHDCGLQIKGYNDILEGDTLEAFQEVAVKKKL